MRPPDVPVGTFLDPEREADLAEQGYAITPLLGPDEVEELRAAYRALVPDGDHGLTVDYMRPDRTVIKALAELLAPVWERHFPELFVDHRPVFATFVTKHPGEGSDMFLHEDRTFVDERRFRSGTLWIPLVDVGPGIDNGGLEVIPKSHHLSAAWSGTGTPELYRPFEPYLRRHLVKVAVPAGSALYYDTRTLHASPANLSPEPRESIVCAVAPAAADWIHVVATSRRRRRILRVDPSFYLDVHPHAVAEVLDDYPVAEELVDDARLGAEAVLAVLPPPGAEPVLATDDRAMRGLGEVPGLCRWPRRVALRTADLAEVAADLAPAEGVELRGLTLSAGAGRPGAMVVDAATTPGWVAEVVALAPIVGGSRVPVVAVIVDPGESVVVTHDPAFTGTAHLDVIDAATAAAVLELGGLVEPLDEGRSLALGHELLAGRSFTVRHNGPGSLALVLTSALRAPEPAAAPTLTASGSGARGSVGRLVRAVARRGRA